MDYAKLEITEALPSLFHGPDGAEDVFRRLRGAEIMRLGSTAAEGIEGGGLVLDYKLSEQTYRLVFAFSELGMWVVYDSFTFASSAESRRSPVEGLRANPLED